MRILIAGDVHGRHRELAEALRQARADYRITAAIQVGDFGFTKAAIRQLRTAQLSFPVPVHAIDGNHEDHRWLRRALLTGEARRWREELNLVYQSRSSVARFGSSKVGFLGGALHVDRPQRHNLWVGFPNYILRRQRQNAVTLFNRERPDLLVTHSCPAGIGLGLRGPADHELTIAEHIEAAGFEAGPEADRGEVELTRLWQALTHRPKAWAFGHFHRRHEVFIEGTHFVGVADDFESPKRHWVIWDTEEKMILHCPAHSGT